MLKRNGGITLIALVVTIIVLLILAGISIAMLTGNNGIITRTNDSKMSQIEGQVEEEIKLAVQSAKIDATQKSVTTSSGYFASANVSDVEAVMGEDLPAANYAFTHTINGGSTYVKVVYNSDNYDQATNDGNATIEAYVKITNNKFEIVSMKAIRSTTNNTKNVYPIGNEKNYTTYSGYFN